ncbi:uncharacterized protein LOC111698488 [Eurytemora carolleeae]|uniref:uncharacterized protein LOC111698488 n=1 Tax=Eurytemora carolleeae TaxID=1294199 RepID=UPI000C75CA73|nr:uncharacterized protein LOC111698488 [Eurytemora carolleeae]|eukprot:XP_023324605.1 uncharacterized protein LOC111698488 [Eurytemora affinis]
MAETKTEYGARSIYDRRNPYRRPSALGVPSRSQWNPSEYDDLYVAKEGGRETYRKPSDNLEQERGIDGTSISKLTYVPKDVERGQPIKPSNHFEYDGLDFAKGTEHGRFQEYDIGKRERGVKKEDNIPRNGRAVGKSETQDHYIEKDGKRVLVRGQARESNLEYNGLDFKEGSENRKYLTEWANMIFGKIASRCTLLMLELNYVIFC